jgi:hypothetical protein
MQLQPTELESSIRAQLNESIIAIEANVNYLSRLDYNPIVSMQFTPNLTRYFNYIDATQ